MNINKWQKFLLTEISKLPREAYEVFEEDLLASKYWEKPNDIDDVVGGKTPLTKKLQKTLQNSFAKVGLAVVPIVRIQKDVYVDEDWDTFLVGAEHRGDHKGREAIKLEIAIGNLDEMPNYDPEQDRYHVASVIRHELTHSAQLHKQAEKRGISLKKADILRSRDPKQVYRGSDPEGYLSAHTEIDAYAHQAAELLLRAYDKDELLDYLSMSLDNPNMPDFIKNLPHFRDIKNKKVLDKFRSRVYAYVEHLAQEGI